MSWTCENVRLVSEAFTTVEDADINNMNNTEFIDCLADIGSLTSWSAAQKTLLLAKTESVSILKEIKFAVCIMNSMFSMVYDICTLFRIMMFSTR